MLRSFLSSFREEGAVSQSSCTGKAASVATLLVLQADGYDWPALLKGAKLRDGRAIRVVQTGWEDITVHADTYSSAKLCVEVDKLAKSASAPETGVFRNSMTVQPDFLLVRNEVKTPNFDGRNVLNGFLFADIPAMNSLESILLFCERPAVQGQLHRLERRLGTEAFPMVPQHFACSSRSLMYGYTFPAVVKVGSAHAGAGKMRISDHRQMSDFRSVLAMMPREHCMVEPFVEGQADLRIQKIGGHYRAFRRVGISGEWKTNTGTSVMEEVDCSERWRAWADASAEMFGGLDILTVDAIVEEGTGKEFILEVNGTSSGLHPERAAEDNAYIAELLLERMNSALC
jgi:glutathione synthase/RimK-type ligase-like ATP-grasp enzyme